MIRPYRLINNREIKQLTQRLNQSLARWNHLYTVKPLALKLEIPTKTCFPNEGVAVWEQNQQVAFMASNYIDAVKQAAFGVDYPCFNQVSCTLTQLLMQLVFEVPECRLETEPSLPPEWIYKGSTCLLLILYKDQPGMHLHLKMMLNPEWVYQWLTFNTTIKKTLDSLDEALDPELLNFNLELTTLTLPLHQLLGLQKGDVISSDHPISQPLKLIQKQQTIAKAHLGKSEHYKSIVIKELI